MVTQSGEIGILEELHGGDPDGVGRYDIDDGGENLATAAQLSYGINSHAARQQIHQYEVHLIAHQKAHHQRQGHGCDEAGAGIEKYGKRHGHYGEGDQIFRELKTVMKQTGYSQDEDNQKIGQQQDAILPEPGVTVDIKPGVEKEQQNDGDRDHPDFGQPELDPPGGCNGLGFGGCERVEFLEDFRGYPGIGIHDPLVFQDEALGDGHLVLSHFPSAQGGFLVVDEIGMDEVDEQIRSYRALNGCLNWILGLEPSFSLSPGLFPVQEKLRVHYLFHPLAGEGNGRFFQLALGQIEDSFGEDVPDNFFQLILEPAVIDRPAFRRFPSEEATPVGGAQIQRKPEGEIAAQVFHLGTVAIHGLLSFNIALFVAIAVSLLAALSQPVFGPLDASRPGE